MKNPKYKSSGFTIVELLIVIITIAILAAISIVAYKGFQNRASDAAVQTEISQFYKHSKTQDIMTGKQYSGWDEDDIYKLISPDDVSSDCIHDEVGYYGNSLRSCKLTPNGRQKVEAYLGGSPSAVNYYKSNTSDTYSLVITSEWDGQGNYTPAIIARSKSGKVFMIHQGNMNNITNYDAASERQYLTEQIEYYEQYEACANGSLCEYGWWTSEDTTWWNNEGRVELVRLREELSNVEENANPSLNSYIWLPGDHIYFSAAHDSWYIGGEGRQTF